MPIFVDTNVLVYARDAAEGEKRLRAQDWLRALWVSRSGRLSAQVLNEYYVTVTRKMHPSAPAADVQAEIRELLAWNPIPTDDAVIAAAWEVEERFGFSYWDALIVAAARLSACDCLLTEDLSDGQQLAGITVVNPFLHQPDAVV